MARKSPGAKTSRVDDSDGGPAEGHGGVTENKTASGLFRTKSMPKNRTHAFHFPLQAVKKDTAQRETEQWEDVEAPLDYGVESPTIPPPVALARGSMGSEGTSGRGSKRLTM